MRILISNKYYYPRGGGEIYTIELAGLLIKKGHEVAIFAMQHPRNIETEYSEYFPSEVDVNKRDIKNLLLSLVRPFGSRKVILNFKKLIREFKPDIVHLNNIHSQLSPVLALIAFREKIPVVWTLHDHKLLCPRYDCIRDDKPCELCFENKYNVIRYRCMKKSLIASVIAYFEAIIWNKKLLGKITGMFINPSCFLQNNMEKGGYDKRQMKVIHNFIMSEKLTDICLERDNYFLYVGRLSKEKGIETLLKAASALPQFKLIVAGTGPLEEQLKRDYSFENISFVGFKKWDDLKTIICKARFLVMPSECYENNPLSIIESLCFGTPVLGARIGGIPELISEGTNGFTFESGSKQDLISKVEAFYMKSQMFDSEKIAAEARRKYSSEFYYSQVLDVYESLNPDNISR